MQLFSRSVKFVTNNPSQMIWFWYIGGNSGSWRKIGRNSGLNEITVTGFSLGKNSENIWWFIYIINDNIKIWARDWCNASCIFAKHLENFKIFQYFFFFFSFLFFISYKPLCRTLTFNRSQWGSCSKIAVFTHCSHRTYVLHLMVFIST